MRIKNTYSRYGFVTIGFHWMMAVLIIGMLSLGLYMISLPKGPYKFFLYGWHKQIGAVILILSLVRLFWRVINITPTLALPLWEKFTALAVHWGFYGLMIAMPLSGWLMTNASGRSVSFFKLFDLPILMSKNDFLNDLFGNIHEYLAYLFIAAIILHTIAALKHHYVDKDDILKRMLR